MRDIVDLQYDCLMKKFFKEVNIFSVLDGPTDLYFKVSHYLYSISCTNKDLYNRTFYNQAEDDIGRIKLQRLQTKNVGKLSDFMPLQYFSKDQRAFTEKLKQVISAESIQKALMGEREEITVSPVIQTGLDMLHNAVGDVAGERAKQIAQMLCKGDIFTFLLFSYSFMNKRFWKNKEMEVIRHHYDRIRECAAGGEQLNIYATNLGYMNDVEEYANGVRELRDIFNARVGRELITKVMLLEVLENEITSYSISFSKARDLLSQWSMYAGESGVSLKMNFSGEEEYQAYLDHGDEKAQEREKLPDKVDMHKVYYCTKAAMEEEEYERVADDIWGETGAKIKDIEDEYSAVWKQMAPFVKRAEFKAEAEHRLVFNMAQWERPFRIDYRISQHVLKPYLDIECEGGWPIHEVVVGPGFNQNVVFQSILHFLNHRGLKVPKLDGSQYCKRCEEYLGLCGVIPKEARKIWDESRRCFDNNAVNPYNNFMKIRRDMMKVIKSDDEFGEQLRRRELTKEGIILSRSRIPYIF